MASFKKSLILLLCLATLCRSAPTETDSSTSQTVPQAQDVPSSTPAPDSSSPVASTEAGSSPSPTTTTPAADAAPASSESPATTTTTTAPAMPVASAQENHSQLTNSSFTCYGRQAGYYADVDLSCKVYHFCLPGKFNGEEVFQRISYLCLNQTLFDQQVLDCVDGEKMVAPCSEAPKHFDSSNTVLRQALIGQSTNTEHNLGTNGTVAAGETTPIASTTSTTPAPTSS